MTVINLAQWRDEHQPTPKEPTFVFPDTLWGSYMFVCCEMLEQTGPRELAKILRDTATQVRKIK